MNYNTSPALWEEFAKCQPKMILIIRDGHVFDGNDLMARFTNSQEAEQVLKLAGCQCQTPTKARYVIVHHPGLMTEFLIEYDTGYKSQPDTRFSWADARNMARQACETARIEPVIERPDQYTEVFSCPNCKHEFTSAAKHSNIKAERLAREGKIWKKQNA